MYNFKNLENFLDGAKDEGVILFSMGTNVKSSDIQPDKLQAFFNVFSKLKQKIIWKWEDDKIPAKKPSNVLMQNWLPQDDILAHPNVRLFISHCGAGGIGEAKYHGVPILGIPIFGDQPNNAISISKEGWGVHLPYDDITEKSLSEAINEILTNQTYTNKVKKLSLLYRDRPLNPLDTAVYWVEYVLRHNGAKHMQSEAVHLNIFQKCSLDVIAFLVVVCVLIVKVIKKISRKFCCPKTLKLKTN